MHSPAKGHERAISESSCTFFNHSSPVNPKIPENDDAALSPPLPTTSELRTLLALPLLDEHGQEVMFGDILNDPAAVNSDKAVIVLFIRHFWCPLDQDYVQEVGDILRNKAGKKAIPEVIIISNGSHALIAKYKEIFDLEAEKGSNLKVKMYTDPTCRTYGILGMENVGEACIGVVSTPSTTHVSTSRSYVKHTSVIGGIATVVLRAIKVGMPVWEKGGAIKQLGGELVTGRDPEMQVACVFAHRMRNTQDHTPFGDVLKIA
ncbi:hypothetical protein F5879DRAFT_808139, partial [Lentinula edodes]